MYVLTKQPRGSPPRYFSQGAAATAFLQEAMVFDHYEAAEGALRDFYLAEQGFLPLKVVLVLDEEASKLRGALLCAQMLRTAGLL